MRFFLRTLFAVVAATALAFALVIAVEAFSAIVHPLPADLNGNIPEHVRRYPHWILGVVVVAWGYLTTASFGWPSHRGAGSMRP